MMHPMGWRHYKNSLQFMWGVRRRDEQKESKRNKRRVRGNEIQTLKVCKIGERIYDSVFLMQESCPAKDSHGDPPPDLGSPQPPNAQTFVQLLFLILQQAWSCFIHLNHFGNSLSVSDKFLSLSTLRFFVVSVWTLYILM